MPKPTRQNPWPPEPCRVVGCPNTWTGRGRYAYLCATCRRRYT